MRGSRCLAYGVAERGCLPRVEAATCLNYPAEVVAALEPVLLLVQLSTACCRLLGMLVLLIFMCLWQLQRVLVECFGSDMCDFVRGWT